MQQPLTVLLSLCDGVSSIKETIYPARLSHVDSLNKMNADICIKDDLIVVTGSFGASSAGLYSMQNFLLCDEKLKEKHLNPTARIEEAFDLRKLINSDVAIMDASDGLADALFKIANSSKLFLIYLEAKCNKFDIIVLFSKI